MSNGSKDNKDSSSETSTLNPEKKKRLEEILKSGSSTIVKISPVLIPLTTEAGGN